MLRAVLDPGVLVSAALSPRAAPAALVRAWRQGAFELVVSPLLLEELAGTLRRQKFRRYLSEDDAAAYVEQLRRNAVDLSDPEIPRERHRIPATTIWWAWHVPPALTYLFPATGTSLDYPTHNRPPVLVPEPSSIAYMPNEKVLCPDY